MDARPDVAYLGLPGTGKTTALMDELEDELRDDTPISRIAGTTFRNNMADEFAQRALEVSGADQLPDNHNFRTTHSLCFKLLGLESDRVVSDEDREEVCDRLGVNYTGTSEADDPDWIEGVGGSGLGAELFQLLSYCRNARISPTEDWRRVPTLDMKTRERIGRSTGNLVGEFVAEYNQYKNETNLVDFDDMLEQVLASGIVPGADLLIEDEFQDKSPLQVAVFDLWAQEIDRVVVAGDPYQSIYQFIGCDPGYMLEAFDRAEKQVRLDTSYRFGEDCWDVATSILKRADYDVHEIEPVGETEVERINEGMIRQRINEHPNEDTLHLARCNYILNRVADLLADMGIPFNSKAGPEWTPKQRALYNAVAKVADTLGRLESASFGSQPDFGSVTLPEIYRLAQGLKASYQSGTKKGNIADIEEAMESGSRDDINLLSILDVGEATAALTEGNPFRPGVITTSAIPSDSIRQRLYRAYSGRDGEPIESIDHELTTIHGAKGLEATNVFLHNEISASIESDARPMPRADEDEARVFFVGATRAEERLYLVESNTARKFPYPA